MLAIILGAVLRFIDIGAQSYSMDELWEFSVIRLPFREILGVGDGFPPLFHIVFRVLFIGGLGDFSGRVLSAICGVITVWLVSRLARRIDPRLAAPAAFGVAIAPLLVLLSKEARAYGIFILLTALLLLATWNVLDSGTIGSWTGFVAVAALGMYTHYMFSLALASAEVVILWDLRNQRSRWREWLLAHGALAVLLIPLIPIAMPDFALDAANDYSRTVDVAAIGYAGLSLFTGMTLGPSSRALHTLSSVAAIRDSLPWIILIGVPAGYLLFLGWKALSTRWRLRLGIPFVLPIVLLTIFSALIGTAFRVRYLSWLAIPLVIWLAAGYVKSSGNLRHVAAGALIVLAGIAMVTRDTVADYRTEDARGAAEFIEEHPDVPAVAMVWYMTKPIDYYLGLDSATILPEDEGWGRFDYHEQLDNRIVPIPSVREDDPQMVEQNEVFDEAVPIGSEYFFILSREFHADPYGEFFDERATADALEPVARFAGITIYRGIRGS
jgi:hypothetical protein